MPSIYISASEYSCGPSAGASNDHSYMAGTLVGQWLYFVHTQVENIYAICGVKTPINEQLRVSYPKYERSEGVQTIRTLCAFGTYLNILIHRFSTKWIHVSSVVSTGYFL